MNLLQLAIPPQLRGELFENQAEQRPSHHQADPSPVIAGANATEVRGMHLAHTYDPHRVALTVPAAVAAAAAGSVNGLDFSASKTSVRSGSVIDTIIITVPKNGLYYGVSLTSEIYYYGGGVQGANVCSMLAEYLLGVDAGYSICIPVELKHHTVNLGIWSPTATTGPITDYAMVTFQRRGRGRADEH